MHSIMTKAFEPGLKALYILVPEDTCLGIKDAMDVGPVTGL